MFDKIFWLMLTVLFAIYLSYFIAMSLLSRKKSKGVREGFFPTVSLIIPTFNEARVILRKLNNICELLYPGGKIEVIIVDSASEDETAKLVQKFMDEHNNELNMRLVSLKRRLGKASALNSVWDLCGGEIVVMSDADCLLERNAISELVKAFSDPKVGVVTGSHFIVNSGEFITKKIEQNYRSIFSVLRLGESYLDSTPIVNGQLCAYRREYIENICEDSVCDDIDLAMRIRRKGYRVVYEPQAIFFEFTPRKFLSRLRQKSRRAQGVIQQLLRFSNMMFKPAYGTFGFLIFPFEFFFHVISPIMVTALLILFMLNVFDPSFMITISMMFLLFLGISGLLLLLRYLKKSELNLISIALTFMESQLYLFLGLLPLLVGRTSHKWKIIDDVRGTSAQIDIDSKLGLPMEKTVDDGGVT